MWQPLYFDDPCSFPRPGVEELRGGARDGGDATAGAEDDAEASQEAAEDCH